MNAQLFFVGLFLGVGVGCPYLPLKVLCFVVASVMAFSLMAGRGAK